MRNHHLDLVRVTEAGALSAAEWVGSGNKEEADRVATEAMRERLNQISFSATIAIGEGKKDNSFGLFVGEDVGCDPECDITYEIAVDPIEGTTPTAKGGYEAMSVIALGYGEAFYKTENFYMQKLAVGKRVREHKIGRRVNIRNSIQDNIIYLHEALGKPINRITVCVLDRPRHEPLVAKLRDIGCRIRFISDCDVTACIATCIEGSGTDMYLSVGGAPEAVISAAAMKCMGGLFQARLASDNGEILNDQVLEMEDLARGDVIFAATGITDGQLLRGVKYSSNGPITESIAMRSTSGTIRRITTEHGN